MIRADNLAVTAIIVVLIAGCSVFASPEERLADELCRAFEAQDVEAWEAASRALDERFEQTNRDSGAVARLVDERCPAITEARDGLEGMLVEQERLAERQENLIDVRVTQCGLVTISGTITNRNVTRTRVSAVIWIMHRGSLLLTAVGHAAPIAAGETQRWTADTTGGDPVLTKEEVEALDCRVESIAVFPY